VLATRWPGPAEPADRVIIAGALIAGVTAAVSVPLDRAGIGWVVAGLAGAGVVVAAARRTGSRPGPEPTGSRPDPERIGWALATLALLGSGALRAAGWLFVLCVLAAFVTGSLALAGGRSVGGLVAGALAWPAATLRALPWAARGARAFGRTGPRALAAVAVTALLLLVFGALFASADAAFARALAAVTPDVDPPALARWAFLFTAGSLAVLGAAFLVARQPDLSGLERPGSRRLRAFEWGLPVAALDLLFAAFVAVQFTVLFGGSSHVLGADGPSFAEYARGGFWQLLLVTVLTLAVLGGAARWARRDGGRDRVLLRGLLGTLAALALVVVASALYRMHVYEQAYGFTRLRLLVSACELWLGVMFALVLVAGVRMRAGWLPGAVVGTAVAALLGLVALDPDRFVAERNVDRYLETQQIDVAYLSELSADAVPALDRLPAPLRGCALADIARDLRLSPDDWRGANLARARARELLAASPPAEFPAAVSAAYPAGCGPAVPVR
jgi:hypothetical protein